MDLYAGDRWIERHCYPKLMRVAAYLVGSIVSRPCKTLAILPFLPAAMFRLSTVARRAAVASAPRRAAAAAGSAAVSRLAAAATAAAAPIRALHAAPLAKAVQSQQKPAGTKVRRHSSNEGKKRRRAAPAWAEGWGRRRAERRADEPTRTVFLTACSRFDVLMRVLRVSAPSLTL